MRYPAAPRMQTPGVVLPRPRIGRRVLVEAVVLVAFVAGVLITNYMLTALPNVKLFDLIVFVAGYTLGFRRGAAVATGAWLVYGTLNPWGPAGPLLLITLMASELSYALAGAGVRMLVSPKQLRLLPGKWSLVIAIAAAVSTITYDGVTNAFTGVTWAQMAGSSEYQRWILVALFNPGAMLFSAIHVGSNLILFSLFGAALIKGVESGKNVIRWRH